MRVNNIASAYFVNKRHVKSIMSADRILVIKDDIDGEKIRTVSMYFLH